MTSSVAGREATQPILIIDDDDDVRGVAARVMERLGHPVTPAARGDEGLHALRTAAPPVALVLLDLTMPGMSGLEVLKVIRAEYAGLPVLVMSGYSVDEAAPEMRALAPEGFLQKPFGLGDLRAEVKRILGN